MDGRGKHLSQWMNISRSYGNMVSVKANFILSMTVTQCLLDAIGILIYIITFFFLIVQMKTKSWGICVSCTV